MLSAMEFSISQVAFCFSTIPLLKWSIHFSPLFYFLFFFPTQQSRAVDEACFFTFTQDHRESGL